LDEVKSARKEGGDITGSRGHMVPQASRDKLTPCGGAADQHLHQGMTTDTSSEDHKAEFDRHLA